LGDQYIALSTLKYILIFSEYRTKKETKIKPGNMAHACNPSTWELCIGRRIVSLKPTGATLRDHDSKYK
jgi:hypothetical protein